jgi:hypothetical protein
MGSRVHDVRGDENELNRLRASAQMDFISVPPVIEQQTKEQITVAEALGSRKQDGV